MNYLIRVCLKIDKNFKISTFKLFFFLIRRHSTLNYIILLVRAKSLQHFYSLIFPEFFITNFLCWSTNTEGLPGWFSIKNLPVIQGIEDRRVQPLSWEDLLEKEMATHSNILSWKFPWTEEPGGIQFMGSQSVREDWSDPAGTHAQIQKILSNYELQHDGKLIRTRSGSILQKDF